MEDENIVEEIETEEEARVLCEENFIYCDFYDNEAVPVKIDDLEIFRAYSYSQLVKGLIEIKKEKENQTVTLYFQEHELKEEAFLKVKISKHIDTKNTDQLVVLQAKPTTK